MSILLLVRHGQASFGASDYDALSEVGHEQSRVLGRALAERGVRPGLVVQGGMRRHRETTEGLLAGSGWEVEVATDPGWDEFDHESVIEVHRPAYRDRARMWSDINRTPEPRKAFQALFEEATTRWSSGEHDEEYDESWPAFTDRVSRATGAALEQADAAGTVLVVTSGGPIGLVGSRLLAGDGSLWRPLNRVCVNTGVSKVVSGGMGLSLVAYNGHAHLEHDRRLLTYR